MVDNSISYSALILTIVTGLVYFLKKIHKCSCNKKGIELERDTDDPNNQQEFNLRIQNLINSGQLDVRALSFYEKMLQINIRHRL